MDLPSSIKPFAPSLAVFATIIAFLSPPLLRYADASMLFAMGYGLALGAAFVLLPATGGASRVLQGIGAVFIVACAGGLFAFNDRAITAAQANDRRCVLIERDMLSAHPRRDDGPDLFQALGCRPQGRGSVYAPPTDRERVAGKPLPWGGYAPPQ